MDTVHFVHDMQKDSTLLRGRHIRRIQNLRKMVYYNVYVKLHSLRRHVEQPNK